jgi:hypothetical protein
LVTNKQEYGEYLRSSPEWARKRELVFDRSQGMCERCKWSQVRDIHHLSYDHVFDERLQELQGVCRECHEFLSGVSGVDPLKFGEDWCSLYQAKLKEI